MSVFDVNNKASHLSANAFLDPNGGVTVQRYDTVRYPFFDKLTESQLGFFWRPSEVDITKDSADFKSLTDHEKHIFTSNLKRQILLDSVQGRSPSLALLPCVSLPEIETWIQTWAFSETIHSKSYTHIIRNVYSDPSKIFDELMDIEEIVDCARDISFHYDNLITMSMWYALLGEGTHTVTSTFNPPVVNTNTDDELVIKKDEWVRKIKALGASVTDGVATKTVKVDLYELKKALWMTLMSVNILEGVRFYVSFACSWAFAELKKMEGNAKIIKLICRDENLHLASTQMLLKILPKDDPDFVTIAEETREECIALFQQAVDQEKGWAHYLFKDGSMIGLNEKLLCAFIEEIADKRMGAVGLPKLFNTREKSLPWTQKWISGSEVQTAPQETEVQSYVVGGTKQDVSNTTFSGFKL